MKKKVTNFLFATMLAGSLCFEPFTVNAAADDYGNTLSAAESITLDDENSILVQGEIDYAGDVDVFKFTAPVSGTYVIRTRAKYTDIDSYGEVYNSNGDLIASNDDNLDIDSNCNFYIRANLTENETYYVAVSDYSSSVTGAYGLSIIAITE